jgi:hypothetical protein
MPPRQFHNEIAGRASAQLEQQAQAKLRPSTLITVKQSDEAVARAIRQTRLYSAKTEDALRRQIAAMKERCDKVDAAHKDQQHHFLVMAQRQSATMERQQSKLAELEAQLAARPGEEEHAEFVLALQAKDVLLEKERAKVTKLLEDVAQREEAIRGKAAQLEELTAKMAGLQSDLQTAREQHASMARHIKASSGAFRGIIATSSPSSSSLSQHQELRQNRRLLKKRAVGKKGAANRLLAAPPAETPPPAPPAPPPAPAPVFEVRFAKPYRSPSASPESTRLVPRASLNETGGERGTSALRSESSDRDSRAADFDQDRDQPQTKTVEEEEEEEQEEQEEQKEEEEEEKEQHEEQKKKKKLKNTRTAYTVTFDRRSMGVEIGDEGIIQQILPGSVAARAGVLVGDQIIGIDGVPLSHAFAHTDRPKAREVGAALNRAKRQKGSVLVRFRPTLC